MGAQLAASLFSVGDLFADTESHYEIPIYQRNYAWRNEQIEQLIDDVWSAAEDPDVDEYFLGNLIVAPKVSTADSKPVTYEVVDGQQRLTTLFMLQAWLPGIETRAKVAYASRKSATDALTRLSILADDDDSGIFAGYKVIHSRMSRFSKASDDLERFTSFLLKNVQLVRAVLPDDADLNKYFEIMNTRGQQLEQVDIVKARLMSYLCPDSGDVADQRACLAWIWDACADMDSYIQMALARGSVRLRDKIFGSTWDRLEILSFDDLVPHRPSGASEKTTLSESVSLDEAIRIYEEAPERPSDADDEVGRFEAPIRFPSLLLHTLKVMRASGDADDEVDGHLDDSKLIKLFDSEFSALSEQEKSAKAKEFIETLLRCKFVLDNYVIKREFTATNDGAWSLKRLTRGESVSRDAKGLKSNARFPSAYAPSQDESDAGPMDDETRDVLLLQSLLRVTYTSPRTMHWITLVLGEPVHAMPRAKAAEVVVARLRSYIQQKVRQGMPGEGGPTGFSIERIVYTYLDYLLAQGKSDQLKLDDSFVFVFRNSIEHFFPQHANRDYDGWNEVLPDHPELNMFGNLALVSVSANSKFSNALPHHKADMTVITRQSKKLELMARTAKSEGGWNRATIKQHDREMVILLLKDLNSAGPAV